MDAEPEPVTHGVATLRSRNDGSALSRQTRWPIYPVPRAHLEGLIVRRAREDREFLAFLTHDPRAAVADTLGIPLPERLTVQVVQERTDHLCVILPVDLAGIGPMAARATTGT